MATTGCPLFCGRYVSVFVIAGVRRPVRLLASPTRVYVSTTEPPTGQGRAGHDVV